ncbi:MAG: hypothetical protein ACLP05_07195 [Candidatus Kryptoniota bacterium]
MAQRRYLALLTALVFGVTLSLLSTQAETQIIKNGICPANNSSYGENHESLSLMSGQAYDQSDEVNLFSSRSFSAPQYSPALINATGVGAGVTGTVPITGDYILRVSLLNIYPSMSPVLGSTSLNSEGALIPIEFGIRVPFVNSTLGTLGYTLYGETSAGLLFGWAFPTDGSFLSYSVPNSRFSTGASAYLGIGNTLRMDKFVGLYLNGGMGYFDLFSSSFMPRSNYFVPSVSVGFYFSI